MRIRAFSVLIFLACAVPAGAQAPATQNQGADEGAAAYERACAECPAASGSGAPTRDILRAMSPEAIHNALVNGKMQLQGLSLSEAERLAGRASSRTSSGTWRTGQMKKAPIAPS